MIKDKGEANKEHKEDFNLKPAPVTVAESNQIVQYIVNEHLKTPLNKFTPDIKIQANEKVETDNNYEESLDDISNEKMIQKHPADTSIPTSIIEVLKISDNLLATIAELQNHVNHLTKYTESLGKKQNI